MAIRDLVCISIGHLVLAGTFVLGVMVGVSLTTRKDSTYDNGNEGTEKGRFD